MSGTGGVVVDPVALQRATGVGQATREAFVGPIQELFEFRRRVRAACGARAVSGDSLEEFQGLQLRLAATDTAIDDVRTDVLRSDSATWSGQDPGVARSPWTDPETDSLAVGLTRLGTLSMPSRGFLERLASEGPGVIDLLTDREMHPTHQIQLLLGDPRQFVANWKRAGEGAIDATVTGLGVLAGAAALLTPGGDDASERLFGRRLGEELIAGLIQGGKLLADDPDSFVAESIGLDTLAEDPYRWLGMLAPDLAIEGLSAGIPLGFASRSARGVTRAGRMSRAGQHLLAGSPDGPRPGRYLDLDVQRRGESEWAPADPVVSHRQAPFESPEGWIDDINSGGVEVPGRNNNCVDCARAAEANWRGEDAVAAPVADTERLGVSADRLEEWTGGKLVPASLDEIEGQLADLGPGSSAIVTSAWDTGGAHAYNAVNDGGVVKWVDSQLGEVSTWPPRYQDNVDVSIVIFIGPDGQPL